MKTYTKLAMEGEIEEAKKVSAHCKTIAPGGNEMAWGISGKRGTSNRPPEVLARTFGINTILCPSTSGEDDRGGEAGNA